MSHTRGIGRKKPPQFERFSRIGTPLKSLQAHRAYWPAEQNVSIHRQLFGKTLDGHEVELYTLANKNGLEAKIMTYGGTLIALRVPDRNGAFADIVLGFDELAPYLANPPYFGGLIGRYANRIANGSFLLNGKVHRLARNDGANHLHGGVMGFDKVIWQARPQSSPGGPELKLKYRSTAGEEGYPGNLDVKVVYTLNDSNELRLDYTVTTDAPTVVNLTHHAYFNLSGSETVLNHTVRLMAKRFLPVDQTLIPTGEQRSVEGTPFDFMQPAAIGSRLHMDEAQLRLAGGYDHNWILSGGEESCPLAAEVYEPVTGRVLRIYTTQPGIQFYTGNMLDGSIQGKLRRVYVKHSGLCLEPQHFPDSPNQLSFPSTLLRPDKTYRQTTIYRFAIEA